MSAKMSLMGIRKPQKKVHNAEHPADLQEVGGLGKVTPGSHSTGNDRSIIRANIAEPDQRGLSSGSDILPRAGSNTQAEAAEKSIATLSLSK